jgi:hypothetical protein
VPGVIVWNPLPERVVQGAGRAEQAQHDGEEHCHQAIAAAAHDQNTEDKIRQCRQDSQDCEIVGIEIQRQTELMDRILKRYQGCFKAWLFGISGVPDFWPVPIALLVVQSIHITP